MVKKQLISSQKVVEKQWKSSGKVVEKQLKSSRKKQSRYSKIIRKVDKRQSKTKSRLKVIKNESKSSQNIANSQSNYVRISSKKFKTDLYAFHPTKRTDGKYIGNKFGKTRIVSPHEVCICLWYIGLDHFLRWVSRQPHFNRKLNF